MRVPVHASYGWVVEDLSWLLELYSSPTASWPAFAGAGLAASLRRGHRWLFIGGAALSVLGALIAWQAPDDDGEGFLAFSSQMFFAVLTVWWTITWLPGVLVGYAIRRAISARPPVERRRPDEGVRRRPPAVHRPAPALPRRCTRRDLQTALAPYVGTLPRTVDKSGTELREAAGGPRT
jgi:hypothetical protein